MPKRLRVPSYRRFKTGNLGFVDIGGKRKYLGRWNSSESKEQYEEIVKEWMKNQTRTWMPKRAD